MVSSYIAITRTLPVLERRVVIVWCGVQPQASSSVLLLFLVIDCYCVQSYGLRIAVCFAAATVLKIGFNIDQKVYITLSGEPVVAIVSACCK